MEKDQFLRQAKLILAFSILGHSAFFTKKSGRPNFLFMNGHYLAAIESESGVTRVLLLNDKTPITKESVQEAIGTRQSPTTKAYVESNRRRTRRSSMEKMTTKELDRALSTGLKALRMSGIRDSFHEMADLARQESLSFERFLLSLVEQEQQRRNQNRVQRELRTSAYRWKKTLRRLTARVYSCKLDTNSVHFWKMGS